MKILVTGGAGYIALYEANYDFIVYDNLSNSSKNSLKVVEKIIGKTIENMCEDSWRLQSNNPDGYKENN